LSLMVKPGMLKARVEEEGLGIIAIVRRMK